MNKAGGGAFSREDEATLTAVAGVASACVRTAHVFQSEAALRRSGRKDGAAEALAAHCRDRLAAHERHIRETGTDLPEIDAWRWPGE